MEYDFVRDLTGKVLVKSSMGHEAIGQWLNEEVSGNISLLDQVEQQLDAVAGSLRQWQHIGHEYTLLMDGEEVMVRANDLLFVNDELEDGMSYYDDESLALCGTDDFRHLLQQYRAFLTGNGR